MLIRIYKKMNMRLLRADGSAYGMTSSFRKSGTPRPALREQSLRVTPTPARFRRVRRGSVVISLGILNYFYGFSVTFCDMRGLYY
jgi:hypothetical protein